MHPPLSTLDEDAWDDLLNFIEERRVIPIIGPELLTVETDAGPRLLYEWIAEKLAAKLNVDTTQLPQPYTLNDVVCWFLSSRGRREEAYTRLRSILREANFAPPLALRRLAQITDFNLFVTTTFDPLLEQAINAERFGGAQSTEVIAYAPNRVADLATEREAFQRPVVYHLLGRLSASPTYVISDEDTLEFICALQSEHLTPEKLFHELEHNHLLFIGSSFTNWLARLFLRMAKRRRLSDPRDVGEVLADNHSGKDGRLMAFLQQVSVRTRIYSGAENFVNELHRRWLIRSKPGEVIPLHAAPQRFLPPEHEMPDNAVFISYAREDLAAVQKMKAGFDAAGIKTWFDLDRLEGGDDYDRKIQRNIARCSYLHSGGFGDDAAPAGRILPPRMELRHRPNAQHRRWRHLHPAGVHRRHRHRRGAGAGQVPRRALHAPSRRRSRAGIRPAHPRTCCRPDERLDRSAGNRRHPVGRRRSAPMARPCLLHRGDARLFLRSRGGSRRARPPRPAQAADDPVRPVGPGQDVDPARGHRPAAAAGRLLPGLRAHRLFARIAGPDRADQAGDLSRNAGRWRVDADRVPPCRASRCGNSCTIATTCCATSPARR